MQHKNRLILIVALIAAAAFPVAAHQAISSYHLQQQLQRELSQLKRQQLETRAIEEQEKKYQEFVAQVDDFIEQISLSGMDSEGWDRHQVEIDEIEMTVAQLDRVVRQAQHGNGYYFIPDTFEIRSLRHRSGTLDLKTVLQIDKTGTQKEKVMVSMMGEFMVRK